MPEGIVQNDNTKTYAGKGLSDSLTSEEAEERLKKIASRLFGGDKAKLKKTV